jgi:DnaK suppressor protein
MTRLTLEQRSDIEQRLRSRRSELLSEIRTALVESGDQTWAELAGRVHDSADEAVADVLADVNAARIDREVTELRETESALERLAGPAYGSCADCDGQIPVARLMAQPAALRCMVCQTRVEHTLGRPPSL